MKLQNLFDPKLLQTHLLNRVVSEMRHPEHKNLAIYNYTHVAQHDNVWDNVTEQCRGLIVDTNIDEVLARPFRKFFNLNTSFRPETLEANLPSWKPRVLEKLDGSLGILYWWNGKPSIATRGSFASDQAIWATNWYRENVWRNEKVKWPSGFTPLFEIIYTENRIVVSYDFEGLVLLGFVSIDTGFEISPEEVGSWGHQNGLRVAKEYPHSLAECRSDATPNTEGFVLQYWHSKAPVPLRVKVKTEDYVRLHKVITGLNPRGIWEHLSLGYNPEALWVPATVNKPFVHWCLGWINNFQRMYGKLESEAISAFGSASIKARRQITAATPPMDARAIRKCYAMAFQEEPAQYAGALFAMLDGKDYQPVLWKLIEPKLDGKEVYIRDADQFNGI